MTPRADLRRIAAEYVIGTLDAAERAAWQARMVEDEEVADLVAMWEHRLAPLNELSAPARPPEGLFDLILSRLPVPPISEAVEEAAPEQQIEDVPAEDAPAPEMAETLPDAASGEVAPDEPAEMVLVDGATADAGAPAAQEDGTSTLQAAFSADEPHADGEASPEPAAPAASAKPQTTDTDSSGAVPADVTSPAETGAPEPRVAESEGHSGIAPPVADPVLVPAPSSLPPASPEAAGNPWRRASGFLMLALLLGGGAFVYRELHHRALPPPMPEPPREVQAQPDPPPAEPAPRVPQSFAVLGPQPVPAIGFAFDHKAGTVSVLKMSAPPRPGMHYHLWLVTDYAPPRHVASFDTTGTFPSDLIQDVDAETLAGALLMVTEEGEGAPPPAPTRAPVFSGMAVRH